MMLVVVVVVDFLPEGGHFSHRNIPILGVFEEVDRTFITCSAYSVVCHPHVSAKCCVFIGDSPYARSFLRLSLARFAYTPPPKQQERVCRKAFDRHKIFFFVL
jgi:hypothetical protein